MFLCCLLIFVFEVVVLWCFTSNHRQRLCTSTLGEQLCLSQGMQLLGLFWPCRKMHCRALCVGRPITYSVAMESHLIFRGWCCFGCLWRRGGLDNILSRNRLIIDKVKWDETSQIASLRRDSRAPTPNIRVKVTSKPRGTQLLSNLVKKDTTSSLVCLRELQNQSSMRSRKRICSVPVSVLVGWAAVWFSMMKYCV